MTPLLVLILVHAGGDLILELQSNRMEHGLKGILCHSAGLGLMALTAMHFFGIATALKIAATIVLAHFAVDWGSTVLSRVKPRIAVLVFVAKQALYLYILTWIVGWLAPVPDLSIIGLWSRLFPPLPPTTLAGLQAILINADWALSALIVYIYVACAGSTLVRLVLNSIGFQKEVDDAPQSGKYIGILERVIILTFVLSHAPAAAAFVLTAKSIVRYPKLSDDRSDYSQRFAEYYLIGTLSSTLVALSAGLLLQTVWQILG